MLLMYQIKVGFCLIAFYLLWKLLLSRETFHRFNRVALLTVMALALVLPWIRLSLDALTPVAQGMVMLEDLIITPNNAVTHQATPSWNWTGIASALYFIGIAMVLVWPYLCDITYTTNSELGFDYLRDNMAVDMQHRVLRGLEFCIIDEADSILIDESRTPLIISGGARASASQYTATPTELMPCVGIC